MVRKLTTWKIAVLTFVSVAGSPFGSETAVRSAGSLPALLTIFLMPLLYVLPVSLIFMELGSWMPTNEGSILWVQRAHGPFAGFFNAVISSSTSLIDIAIYPVLFSTYTQAIFPDLSDAAVIGYRMIFIFVGGALSFLPVDQVGNIMTIISSIALVPLIVGVLCKPQHLLPNSTWGVMKDNVDWGSMLATVMWLFCVDQMAFMTGELQDPAMMKRGLLFGGLMVASVYLIPIISLLPLEGDWADGYFAVGFNQVLPGLGYAIGACGCVAGFNLYVSLLAVYGRNLWAVAKLGFLPKPVAALNKFDVPYVGTLICIVTAIALSFSTFDFIVTLEAALGAIAYALSYVAVIKLRYQFPEAENPRPASIGGGKFGLWLCVVPAFSLQCLVFCTTIIDPLTAGVVAAVFGSLITIFGVMRFLKLPQSYGVDQKQLEEISESFLKAKEE